ncbi:arsenate reductase [Azoarcus olearius]|uniref:arsenate reductase (glutaredoxin) n=1 Tax=Azoarcus sp. (strain BH72) TaxID=418699 RepID=UPI000806240A|nr:arsenate reductase (glutaredoxin) [Azoarcus olearius]ANQ85230.1 arsenate reductase [Azoarcus olearius]
MTAVRIYHNPRCGKSRSACALIAERDVDAEVVEYLKHPLGRDELRALLDKLGLKPQDLIRRGEAVFKEHFAGKALDDEEWIDAMVAYPILMERPIVVRGERAVVARPPERVAELFD